MVSLIVGFYHSSPEDSKFTNEDTIIQPQCTGKYPEQECGHSEETYNHNMGIYVG